MSRSSRREKVEATVHALEERFSADLTAALIECAAGTWGMFGAYDAAFRAEKWGASEPAETLLQDGGEIERLRRELGYTESFPLFKRYLEYRQMQGSNRSGEPKLAMQFLRELGKR
jgi:hypothetical protein